MLILIPLSRLRERVGVRANLASASPRRLTSPRVHWSRRRPCRSRPGLSPSPQSLSSCCSRTGCAAEYVVLNRVDNAGQRLSAHPGAVEAATYAQALHDAAAAHAFAHRPAEFRRQADEALAALTRNETTAGPDKPQLAALRGVLLLDLGRNDEAWAELQRSMALRPTLLAAGAIVPALRQQGRHDDVVQTCDRSARAITGRDELYRLIQLCAANMDAPDDAAALAWATPEQRAFFDAEKARRKREAQEALEAQEAMDEAVRASQAATDTASQAISTDDALTAGVCRRGERVIPVPAR